MYRRRAFTQEDDSKLLKLVKSHGQCWAKVAKSLGNFSAKECKSRYSKFIQNRTQWTEEEEALLIEKYKEMGPHWVQISCFFHGKTGNDIKNRWHKHLVKRYQQLPDLFEDTRPIKDGVSNDIESSPIDDQAIEIVPEAKAIFDVFQDLEELINLCENTYYLHGELII